ncbi:MULTISPECIES: glycosyltransferase family 2 protein [Sphingobacterium]|uniref:glycosyltransferase family 2 protein n=1 Tax=Sphingobacterium TaxID=28453 RepID=UPI00257FC720|nr:MULTISPECIES: glycosyltransferase family 2 protein [Sphingobacterium]
MIKKQTINNVTCSLLTIAVLLAIGGCKSPDNKDRTWSVYKADGHSSSYSPLEQINVSNVSQLKPTWTFDFKDMPDGSRPALSQNNPIIVDGVLYTTSAKLLAYAMDAATGKQLWSYDPFDGGDGNGPLRGVTYWEKGSDKRIILSADNHLIALDARTGKPVPSFGDNGKVNMNIGLRDDPEKISVSLTTPGIIYKDLIIIGSRLPDVYDAPPGYIRAYDCNTGKLVWTFHTIPHPGEPGYETWPKDAYKYAGGANNWAGMSLDNKRGIVYMALGSPSYDFYAADREGQNLYGNSVLALDAATGNYVWHYQIVHHDIWDYDLPSPPNLVTIQRGGKDIDAVVQLTKHGFVFVFNRETGEPLFPIEERKVPQSNMPGEKSWATQPFPLKPAPFSRQLMTEADLTRYSEADHKALVERFRSLRYEGLFTPPDLKGTLMMPGTRGGAEWGGAAYDPATSMLYFKSNDAPDIQTRIWKRIALGRLTVEVQAQYLSSKAVQVLTYAHSKRRVPFIGNMGIIRRSILEEKGQWNGKYLCEDMELSRRLILDRNESIFVDHPYGKTLLPSNLKNAKQQFYRWAFGNAQIFRDFFVKDVAKRTKLAMSYYPIPSIHANIFCLPYYIITILLLILSLFYSNQYLNAISFVILGIYIMEAIGNLMTHLHLAKKKDFR